MKASTTGRLAFGRGAGVPLRFALIASALFCLAFCFGASGQESGPIHPPPPLPATAPPVAKTPTNSSSSSGTGATAQPSASQSGGPSPSTIQLPPPTIPVDEIIKKFAAHEDEFKEARGNYTYTQTVIVKDFGPNGEEGGEYRMVSDIIFTPAGKRYENVTFAPASSLIYIQMSPEDISDLRNIQPFVLTTDELAKYDIKYVDHEPVDQLTAYVFDVAPKRIEKGQRYFQGRVWVEDKDFAVVKSRGKAVPDSKDNKFATFDTYRENIAGSYWFPTYTHADDVLHFDTGGKHPMPTQDTRIVMTVKYENYKYFGVKIKIAPVKQDKPQDKPNNEEEQPEPPQF